MAPATKHLLLLIGTILLAQRATAQFDYNTTWLGTVLAFVNVSIIPGHTVTDEAMLFTALTEFSMFTPGYSPRDPVTAFRLNYTQHYNHTQFLNANGLQGKRIGVISSSADNPANDP
ncbi:TPA: hypothetical protein ACH3X2_005885 [Trebouxia sp. C0005]